MDLFSDLKISSPIMEASTQMLNALFEGVMDFDDNLAAKFADTTNEIYKMTMYVANEIAGYGEDFVTSMKPLLDSPERRYEATVSFNFADMGISEDLLKLLPPKLYISFRKPEHSMVCNSGNSDRIVYAYTDSQGLMIDMEEGNAEYVLVTFIMYEGMFDIDLICKLIKLKLTHELRHVVDTCDAAMLQVMQDCLNNNYLANVTKNFSQYWSDPGEYYARLTEVCTFAINVLSNPENRKKIHSAAEVVERLSTKSRIYSEALGNVDDAAKQQFNKHLELILAKIMDKLA